MRAVRIGLGPTGTGPPRRADVELVGDLRGRPSGTPVVLVHGGGESRRAWAPAVDRLVAAGHLVLAYDQRGHGDSAWTSTGYDLGDFAGDLDAMARLLPRPGVLVGASVGGMAAVTAVGELGTPALGVVLVDAVHEPSGSDLVTAFFDDHVDGFEDLADAITAIARFRGRPTPTDEQVAREVFEQRGGRWCFRWDAAMTTENDVSERRTFDRVLAAAARIDVPMLLLRAERSPVVTDEALATFQSVCHLLEVVPVPTGHSLNARSVPIHADHIARFVAAVDGALDLDRTA